MRGRFGLVLRLNHYDVPELTHIVNRSAKLLNALIEPEGGAEEIARRARGTPRIANRLLRRVRDYAQVRAEGHITSSRALRPRSIGWKWTASGWMKSIRRLCKPCSKSTVAVRSASIPRLQPHWRGTGDD